MRYYNYLNEDKITSLVDLIKDKCKPFLKDWNGINFLYRGMKQGFDYKVLPVRTDRKPKDMPIDLHNMFDNAFQSKFGWKARSNSVFCTGDKIATEEYGNCFVIFPIGNYQFISSPNIEDLYFYFTKTEVLYSTLFIKHFGKEVGYDYSAVDEFYNENKNDKQIMKKFNNYVVDLVKTYDNKNINRMIMKGNEIMINCKEYIAFHDLTYDYYNIREYLL